MITKKGVFLFALVSVLLLHFVSASTSCSIGSVECSDGIDNDGDGGYDFGGTCYVDSDNDGWIDSDEALEACDYDPSTYDPSTGLDWCDKCSNKSYEVSDLDCVSPLDISESGNGSSTGSSAGAPAGEEEKGFWVRLWEFLVFWN